MPVRVGDRLLDGVGEIARESCGSRAPSMAFVVADAALPHLRDRVSQSLARAGVRVACADLAADERAKVLSTVESLSRSLAAAGADRQALVVAVGGGIVGDVAGFVAATWMRGVRWMQAPTTLLGMVDAALGGKTAVNLALDGGALAKNMVGAIWQPCAVVCDVGALASLPSRSFRAGLAEGVKHALIADRGLLAGLRALESQVGGDADARRAAAVTIARAAQVKIDIVERDERERGERRALNLGHTFAHAIEAACAGEWLHGEAVSIGIVAAMAAAQEDGRRRAGSTRPSDAQVAHVRDALADMGLPVRLHPGTDMARIRAAMHLDKKRDDAGLTLILPRGGPGDGAEIVPGAADALVDAGLRAIEP